MPGRRLQVGWDGIDGADGQKLGKVNGFIVDSATGRRITSRRRRWVVHVEAVPGAIGHVAMNAREKRLMAELTRDRVRTSRVRFR